MQQQQKRKISDEGAKAFQEFADKTMYEIPADKLPSGYNFTDTVHRALNCFSPVALRVPTGFMIEMLSNKITSVSYTNFNILKQIVVQATGRAMNMQPKQYAQFLQVMEVLNADFGELWNAAIAEHEEKYPFIDVTEVEIEPEVTTKSNVIAMPVVGQA
jgi:hypothetical protein